MGQQQLVRPHEAERQRASIAIVLALLCLLWCVDRSLSIRQTRRIGSCQVK